jgi:hypothetical protein
LAGLQSLNCRILPDSLFPYPHGSVKEAFASRAKSKAPARGPDAGHAGASMRRSNQFFVDLPNGRILRKTARKLLRKTATTARYRAVGLKKRLSGRMVKRRRIAAQG